MIHSINNSNNSISMNSVRKKKSRKGEIGHWSLLIDSLVVEHLRSHQCATEFIKDYNGQYMAFG